MDNRELSIAVEPVTAAPIGPMESSEAERAAFLFSEIVASLPYYNEAAKTSETAKYSAEDLRRYSAEDPDSVLLARHLGEIVGICISRLDDSIVWLSWFVVDHRYRRMSIGKSLIKCLEQSVRSRRIHKIWCDCRTENTASKALLLRNGFEPLCTVRNHWYGQDFILWEKSLA